MVHQATNFGLIWDQPNPISKAKVGATLLQGAFQNSMYMDIDTPGFANLRDIPIWTERSESQASTDAAGSTYFMVPQTTTISYLRPYTLCPLLGSYVLVSHELLIDMLKDLGTFEQKVTNIKKRVQPWVKKEIKSKMQGMQT